MVFKLQRSWNELTRTQRPDIIWALLPIPAVGRGQGGGAGGGGRVGGGAGEPGQGAAAGAVVLGPGRPPRDVNQLLRPQPLVSSQRVAASRIQIAHVTAPLYAIEQQLHLTDSEHLPESSGPGPKPGPGQEGRRPSRGRASRA
jgi:hypothetical protein